MSKPADDTKSDEGRGSEPLTATSPPLPMPSPPAVPSHRPAAARPSSSPPSANLRRDPVSDFPPSVSADSHGRWKGLLALAARDAVLHALGPRRLSELTARLSEEARAVFDQQYIATAWYEEDASGEILEELAALLGRDPQAVALEIGARTVDLSSGQLGQWLMRFISTPERVVGYSREVWSRLRDGDLTAELREGAIVCRLRGWAGHHPLVCVCTQGALDRLGSRMPGLVWLGSARTSCVSDGAPACVYELRFRRGPK
ncbi:MAG: hypothetical protein AB7S68_01450 [Polyangiaceae bacterium]